MDSSIIFIYYLLHFLADLGKDCASSHKIGYVNIFSVIINLEGHLNSFIGSKVTAILENRGDFALWRCCMRKGLHLQPAQQAC